MKLIEKIQLSNYFERWDFEIEGTHNFIAEGAVVHNTSAHISWTAKCIGGMDLDAESGGGSIGLYDYTQGQLHFFSGEQHENFVKLFDEQFLRSKFNEYQFSDITIYGETYGGKVQGMSHTYGKDLKFIVFDVKVGHSWLSVPEAHAVATSFGLDFVHYVRVGTDIEELDAQRDAPSEQAIRNGMSERDKPETHKKREGVVLRPIIPVRKNNNERICAKHKREDFRERKTKVKGDIDATKLQILEEARAIADEWVTQMRLSHVIQHVAAILQREVQISDMPEVIKAMIEDVEREGKGEMVESHAARKAIGSKTAQMYKIRLQTALLEM